MKKEIMELWVVALRSGKYRQGRKLLKDFDGKYCCLGVLCDISGLDTWQRLESNNAETFLGSNGVLPQRVMHWAGLRTDSGLYMASKYDDYTKMSVTFLNDVMALSFDLIADEIEKHWAQL